MPETTRPSAAAAPSWQSLSGAETLDVLQSSLSGLTAAEAAARKKRFGPNALPAKPPPGIPLLFLRQFLSPLIYVLLAAALIALPLGEFSDAAFIVAIVVLNAILGTAQEWKAERSAADLQRLLRLTVRVRRDGGELSMRPGDEPHDTVVAPASRAAPAKLLLTPEAAARVLAPYFAHLDREEVKVALLSRKHRLLAVVDVYAGSVAGASVRIGELFTEAVRRNAPAIVVAHNHPSGDPTPSRGDIDMTHEVRAACETLGIALHDHVVIARTGHASFRTLGLL